MPILSISQPEEKEKIHYTWDIWEKLIHTYNLSSIDMRMGEYGYWLLQKQDNTTAILSLKTWELLRFPRNWDDEYFRNIQVDDIILRKFHDVIHYVVVYENDGNITHLGILDSEGIDFIDEIPPRGNNFSIKQWRIMIASKATLILSWLIPRRIQRNI